VQPRGKSRKRGEPAEPTYRDDPAQITLDEVLAMQE
jgi:phosphatidylglycerophosphatase A